jgi:hypothetical protein
MTHRLVAQLMAIGGFGPEPLRDIEHELACAVSAAPYNFRGSINWVRHFPWLRPRMAELQGNRCCWCRCTMTVDGPSDQRPTFDHIDPLSLGGLDEPDNLANACRQCNQDHGAKPPIYLPVMPWHSDLLLERAA